MKNKIPYCHNEKWDGTGYPQGLAGEEIPLSARIFALVDVWDALISDRPYRKAWEKEKAYKLISDSSGKHFDPDVANVFLKEMKKDLHTSTKIKLNKSYKEKRRGQQH